MSPRRARTFARTGIALVFAAVVVILVANSGNSELIIFGSTPSYPHQIQVTAPSAFEVIPGERMVEGGVGVGTVLSANVTQHARAHIVMGLSDAAWPLPTDSTLTLRMGGTVKFTDRFIDVTKGHATAHFADNASVPARQFVTPVEYDSLFNIFDSHTRASLKAFFDNGGPTLKAAQASFRRALDAAPPVLGQAAAVFRDLGYNQQALSSLVRSTAQLSDAVAASNPGVRTLLTGAGQTFGTIASQSSAVQRTIASGRFSLFQIGHMLTHIGHTYARATTLARRLAPGVDALNRIAAPLNSTLSELVSVEPSAVDTLRTVTGSGPTLDRLLTSARTKLMPQLRSVAAQAAVETNCVRPYTPDIMSFMFGWGGFFADGLAKPHVHILHALISDLPIPQESPLNSAQLTSLLPNLHVHLPAAPGEEWNQPWYQPQCNITPADNVASHDPEIGTYDPNGTKEIPFNSITPSFPPAAHP